MAREQRDGVRLPTLSASPPRAHGDRPPAGASRRRVPARRAEAAAYLACEDGATLARVDAALGAAGFDLAEGALENFLGDCVAARLVLRDGAHYLALALPTAGNAASA